MQLLAIEQSTERGSIALLRDGAAPVEEAWSYSWFNNQQLFKTLPGFLLANETEVGSFDTIAVGLGPGSFAGTRVAVAAAQSLALPGETEIYGVSSGEALAASIAEETGATSIVIIGDARRKHIWYGHFASKDGDLDVVTPWALQPVENIADALPADATIAGPEWERLGDILKDGSPSGSTLIEENRFPSASAVAELAARGIGANEQSPPVEPLYLHPPVFVKGREWKR